MDIHACCNDILGKEPHGLGKILRLKVKSGVSSIGKGAPCEHPLISADTTARFKDMNLLVVVKFLQCSAQCLKYVRVE